MSEPRVTLKKPENHYCRCKELQPCSCGHNPPYHCGVCFLELTPEQFAEARKQGWYSGPEQNLA
jgi:hypothetical protein